MHAEYTMTINSEDDWWIGWVDDVPGV